MARLTLALVLDLPRLCSTYDPYYSWPSAHLRRVERVDAKNDEAETEELPRDGLGRLVLPVLVPAMRGDK